MLIGAHVSTAGGLSRAVPRLAEMGGKVLQIFSSSPRMWLAKLPNREEVDKFLKLRQEMEVKRVFIHAKYLLNLASEKEELLEKSRQSLIYDLKVAEMIKADGVIVHLGSHMGRGFEAVKDQLIEQIKIVLSNSLGRANLLIENSAGQKGKIASRLTEIRLLLESVDTTRLGWCLDTCHAWAAGYFSGKSPVNTLIGNDIVIQVKKLDLVKSLMVLHVNDSRDEFASGRDRHANLGQGRMGLEMIKSWVNEKIFADLPMILEVPGFDGQGPDKKNLEILKNLKLGS